jgi:transposase-like protein
MGKQAEGNGARRRQRRSFTPEFKAEVITLVRRGERSLPAIAGSST